MFTTLDTKAKAHLSALYAKRDAEVHERWLTSVLPALQEKYGW